MAVTCESLIKRVEELEGALRLVQSEFASPETFTLRCERRDDGGLRVLCDEVPGLILSGADPREVLRDVAPAIHYMTTRNAKK